jgi:hypothetical protein
VAVAAAAVVIVSTALFASRLIAYPWDWAPDEGLAIDYGRRAIDAPRTLYGRDLIPFPAAYTPLLPLLLAPIAHADAPLLPARLLAVAWTAGACLALFVIVRRRAGAAAGLAAIALVLAPRDFSVWFLLVRVDGLMIALWLGAAAALLPRSLDRGADALSSTRMWWGAALLLGAVLTKPTAALHGAPLVLGWFLVDRRSAWRLSAVMLASGLAALAILQLATAGGFLWTMRLWGIHPWHGGLLETLVAQFVRAHALVLLLAAAAIASALSTGRRPFRDAAWLLVLGGLAIVPALGKSGAWTNYLLPLYCALIAVACRLWPANPRIAILVPSVLAMALLARPAPLPTMEDAATADAFYGYVRARGGPLLATRPDYAYVVVGQPVEAEGSGLPYLVAARVPGTEQLLERVRQRYYRLVVAVPYFWPKDPNFESALGGGYEIAGTCSLAFFYGRTDFIVLLPRGASAPFRVTPPARCRSFPTSSPIAHAP